jgi:hypothetical protein
LLKAPNYGDREEIGYCTDIIEGTPREIQALPTQCPIGLFQNPTGVPWLLYIYIMTVKAQREVFAASTVITYVVRKV